MPDTENNASPPLLDSEEGHAPIVTSESREANMGWVEVSRAARVHAGPSVSASTLRFYPVGTELHFMDYKQGWFRVADPTTSEQGWIYEKYIEATSVSDHTHVPSQPVLQPTQTGFEVSAPRPSVVRAKTQRQKTEPAQPVIHRTELFADLLERAFSGY
jgi:hypothetical protein